MEENSYKSKEEGGRGGEVWKYSNRKWENVCFLYNCIQMCGHQIMLFFGCFFFCFSDGKSILDQQATTLKG